MSLVRTEIKTLLTSSRTQLREKSDCYQTELGRTLMNTSVENVYIWLRKSAYPITTMHFKQVYILPCLKTVNTCAKVRASIMCILMRAAMKLDFIPRYCTCKDPVLLCVAVYGSVLADFNNFLPIASSVPLICRVAVNQL